MQWNDVSTNWLAYTPRILAQWPSLDEAEVQAIEGDQDAFLNYLARVKGDDHVAAQMELADWLMGGEPIDVVMDDTRDNAQISESGNAIPAGDDALSNDDKFGAKNAPEQPVKRAS